jgi:hypothetical protein
VVIASGWPWRFNVIFMKARGSCLVAGLGDVAFQNLTLVVDRAPQVDQLIVDWSEPRRSSTYE